ncbi:MAG: hypothetical protein KF861_20630, partial [Planctomycetaceae bacterium]|nr:hypothetical protein [Planctomycetaceae bacterium]
FQLDEVRAKPHMYLAWVTYDTIVAYLMGIDVAASGGFLLGFDEWVNLRCNREGIDPATNLPWSINIVRLALPGRDSNYRSSLESPENQELVTERLFRELDDFWELRNRRDGLRSIYVSYQRWLEVQEAGDEL